MSSIFADRTNGTCHIDVTKDILVISNNVQGQIGVKVEIFVSKVLGKGELCLCTLLEITKISLVASMWHVLFVRSVKIDDRDQFC